MLIVCRMSVAMLCALVGTASAVPQVIQLPRPDGTKTAELIKALSVSSDGRWIGGYAGDAPFDNLKLLRWDLGVSAEVIDTGDVQVLGAFISDDGQTIASFADSRWTGSGGAEYLNTYPNFPKFPRDIQGMTADGQTLLIRDEDGGAFLWTPTTSTPIPAPRGTDVHALGLSSDGQTVVGRLESAAGISNPNAAFIWREESGFEFHTFGKEVLFPSLDSVSRNGSAAAGGAYIEGGGQLIVWTEDTGAQLVGEYPYEGDATVEFFTSGISDDASIVIGVVDIYPTKGSDIEEPFVWTPSTGILPARDYLLSLGLAEVENWNTIELSGLSADGTTIVGSALVLDPTSGITGVSAFAIRVPAPSAGGLLIGMTLAIRRKRRTI